MLDHDQRDAREASAAVHVLAFGYVPDTRRSGGGQGTAWHSTRVVWESLAVHDRRRRVAPPRSSRSRNSIRSRLRKKSSTCVAPIDEFVSGENGASSFEKRIAHEGAHVKDLMTVTVLHRGLISGYPPAAAFIRIR